LRADRLEAEVRVTATDLHNKVLPPASLAVRGVITHDLNATPKALNLGAVRVGDTVESTVVLASCTGRTIHVQAADFGSEAGTIFESDEAPSRGQAFRVRLKITGRGERSGVASLSVRDQGGENDVLRIPISYFGY
jgi:hypothetical protein